MPAIFLALTVVLFLISYYTGLGVIGSVVVGLVGIAVIFVGLIAYAAWTEDVDWKRQEAQEPSDRIAAGYIAQKYAMRASVDSSLLESYKEQGEETYRYLRRKGLSNDDALQAVERAYADLYDKAERKAIANMTKPSSRRRR